MEACSGDHSSLSLTVVASLCGHKHTLDPEDAVAHLPIASSSAIESFEEKCDTGDCLQQTFRESFYSSGTDWSSLYSVDEYGMPCENREPTEHRHDCQEGSGESSQLVPANGTNKKFKSLQIDYWSQFQSTVDRASQGKLVQSTLSACWGFDCNKFGNYLGGAKKIVHPDHANKSNGRMIAPKYFPKASVSKQESSSVGKTCPFYKKIPGTTFVVDAFRYGAVEGCSAYFLTHFHADHYGGLTKSWNHGPIYCTPVTGRLLVLCLRVNERWIRPIPLKVAQIIDGIRVTLLDANHCPGAAIILFQLKNGQNILHTGDFRASKEMQGYPEFSETQIHTLYLDTTYCDQKYRFPSQKRVIEFVVQVTQSALKKNNRTLVVVGSYSIGKERVYLGIAEALNVPIFVEHRRHKILQALEWPELVMKLSGDSSGTLLHVLPIGYLQPQKLKAYLQGHPKFNSVLAFRPTGWTFSEKVGDQLHLLKPTINGCVSIYGVPYSEHSSFIELQEFVQFLKPQKVIPTVNVGRPQVRDQMKSYCRQWLMQGKPMC